MTQSSWKCIDISRCIMSINSFLCTSVSHWSNLFAVINAVQILRTKFWFTDSQNVIQIKQFYPLLHSENLWIRICESELLSNSFEFRFNKRCDSNNPGYQLLQFWSIVLYYLNYCILASTIHCFEQQNSLCTCRTGTAIRYCRNTGKSKTFGIAKKRYL